MMINIKDKPMAIVAPVPAISSPEHQPQQHIEVIKHQQQHDCF